MSTLQRLLYLPVPECFYRGLVTVLCLSITLTACKGSKIINNDNTTAISTPTATNIINLPKTGQNRCYDVVGDVITCLNTGQDGELQKGIAWPNPRFTVGTGVEFDCVTDNLTGLMWIKEPDGDRPRKTWIDAQTYANKLNLCGYTDWRIPNRKELKSLVNYSQFNIADWLNTQGFSNVVSNYYWSSTTSASSTAGGWYVDMRFGGYVGIYGKRRSYYVLPVRDGLQKGIVRPNPRFTVGTDVELDCVIDNLTGLMWIKTPRNATRKWINAMSYANKLNLCGYTDWRVPNVNELESLINTEQSNTADWLNTQGFSNVHADDSYWSSTTYTEGPTHVWCISMWHGAVYYGNKTYARYVWPVRDAGGRKGGNVK